MTAKTRTGYHGHKTHGADAGTPHEKLMRQHRQPGRREGAAHPGGSGQPSRMPMDQPMPPPPEGNSMPAPAAPDGGDPGSESPGPDPSDPDDARDIEEGDQT